MKRVVVLAGAVVLFALGAMTFVYVWEARAPEPPRAPAARGEAPPEEPEVREPPLAKAPPARLHEAAPAARAPAPAPERAPEPDRVDWTTVPLDRSGGLDTLGPEGARKLQEALRAIEQGAFHRCFLGEPVGEPVVWNGTFELRLEPAEGGYFVREATVLDSAPAVPELEECFHEAVIGRVAEVDAPPGRVRVAYPVRFELRPRAQ